MNSIQLSNILAGMVKRADYLPAGVAQYVRYQNPNGEVKPRPSTPAERSAFITSLVNAIPTPKHIPSIDLSKDKSPTEFQPKPARALLPGGQIRNTIGWLQHNGKAAINRFMDRYTLSGGAPSPEEYQTYKYWREGHVNSMPQSFYMNRAGEQPRPNGPYLNSDLNR